MLQAWSFIPIEIYSVMTLEARGPKLVSLADITVSAGLCSSWRLQGKNLVLGLFQLLEGLLAFLGLW